MSEKLIIIKKYIGISPGLKQLFSFLSEIEKEIRPIIDIMTDDNNKVDSPRSVMISVFCFLDTIFSIMSAYRFETSEKEQIILRTKNNFGAYIDEFLLCKQNTFFLKNKDRLSILIAKDIREFRNSLIHFYAISGEKLMLTTAAGERRRQYEDQLLLKGHRIVVTSPDEFFDRCLSGTEIVFRKLHDDCKKDSQKFSHKISFVIDAVLKNAPHLYRIPRND